MTLPLEEALDGKYEILEKIGEGGIGSVYKVRHRLLDEVRVIKVLRPQFSDKQDHQNRFLHEARMAIRLKHTNIAQLHDFSISDDGTAFIVMEFVDGIALDALLAASGPPSLDLTLEIARQSLRALAYLHAHDLVHRDVSPDNIMLTTSFEGGARVKLIDLGIAKNLAEESGLTQTGVFLGKVRYCSPEQFSSAENQTAELDARSDLYSFGLLLYELLTGVYPFGGKTFAELAGCHLFQPPIAFEESDPEGKVPLELRAVVLKALEKDPEARFASAADFAAQLEGFGTPGSSIEEELNQTVERTTFAIPRPEGYTRPGSTQDRLNAQFGLGATTAKKSFEGSQADKTTAAPRPSANTRASGPRFSEPWVWAAAAAVLAVVGLGSWWLLTSTNGEARTADLSNSGAAAIEVEHTEPFALDDPNADDFVPRNLEIPPPPSESEEERTASAPIHGDRREPGPGSEPEGRRPPPPQQGLQEGQQLPPRRGPGPPPGGPGTNGELIGRTAEIYQRGVGVVPPVLIELAPTVYPDGKRPKTETDFLVEVLVDEFGTVLTARAEGGGLFKRKYRDSAVETAKRSRFRPAIQKGIAGRMWTEIRIVFEAE